MEPGEYQQLKAMARQQNISVAELIRRAVRRCYPIPSKDPKLLVQEIFDLNLPIHDWGKIEQEIEKAHYFNL